jgi:hypothetical protein
MPFAVLFGALVRTLSLGAIWRLRPWPETCNTARHGQLAIFGIRSRRVRAFLGRTGHVDRKTAPLWVVHHRPVQRADDERGIPQFGGDHCAPGRLQDGFDLGFAERAKGAGRDVRRNAVDSDLDLAAAWGVRCACCNQRVGRRVLAPAPSRPLGPAPHSVQSGSWRGSSSMKSASRGRKRR